jgi:23S rRNA (guanosine2251-2'-O)-methyltransferase
MKKLQNKELNRLSIDEFKETEKLPFVIVLDNIRSMHNIGSIFRTSDAFLAQGVYLCGITAIPPHKEIHKTALGSTESVQWKYYENTISAVKSLKLECFRIVCIEQTDNNIQLQDFKPITGEKYAFIFGHEVKGVEQEIVDLCDFSLEVPQYGTKHSLNVSVCAGIVIWDVFRKLKYVHL